MELSLSKFDPTKEELTSLVEKHKDLTINGIEDKEGYENVRLAKKELQKMRTLITTKGKDMRAEALKFQKSVIEYENELVGIISPLEDKLGKMREDIDAQVEREARKAVLPSRIERLAAVEAKADDEYLLSLSPDEFTAYLNHETSKYLAKKEEALAAEKREIDEEREAAEKAKRDAEESERRAQELEDARKEAVAEAERKAAIDKENAIKAERERVDREKKEQEAKQAEEARLAKEEADKLESKRKYKEFLDRNGYTENNKECFYVKWEGKRATLYKQVDAITL